MLSALSRTAARALSPQARWDDWSSSQEPYDAEILYLDLELCDVLRPLPEIAWSKIAHLCSRTVSPAYRKLRDTFQDDMDRLAGIMAELELSSVEAAEHAARFEDAPFCHGRTSYLERPPSKRRRSSAATDDNAPLVIPGFDPSIPTIVITPCPSQPREAACLVPFQDAQFGNRLTVPTHPALNSAFPPQMAMPVPLVEHWRYEDGHWAALLPHPEEQVKRGMFSRPLPSRRRKVCVGRRHRA
ncbi:uncharacterized protein LAESUDRAFT_675887 [Laetiporus sulphureus 93-53]|uniref:Uncharacterized protein n=1 Tax=Laetiporus sulphureus 93-53 TaxID=1314785 RepID=A0A165F930_9APHY|nr:uncharacterized protein LAESUDRAFT_675887 [Laetiporus sulphureus 93-53]KZT08616.1 hypothetical protein LAESUDRAFT_675887 [Laetiporus sulphureus 93-53]